MTDLPCKYCKYFICSYIKHGFMNIECNRKYFEIQFDIEMPFMCGMFKPSKQYKKYLKLKGESK